MISQTITPVWQLQDAKAHFSRMLNACIAEGPQMVTRRGQEAAVLVPVAEWRRLTEKTRPTIKDALLSDDFWRGEMDIPDRKFRNLKHRQIPEFD